jgi:hypothetical protein
MAFNKLFVMLPVMLAARKLDGEDPNIVYWLRVAYGALQLCCVILVAFTYIKATAAAGKAQGTVYVAPAPQVNACFAERRFLSISMSHVSSPSQYHSRLLIRMPRKSTQK